MSRVMRKPTFCICENKDADQCLCFRYIDRNIPVLSNSEISRLYPSSLVVQPSFCRTWSETSKTGFLTTRLIYSRKRFEYQSQTTEFQNHKGQLIRLSKGQGSSRPYRDSSPGPLAGSASTLTTELSGHAIGL